MKTLTNFRIPTLLAGVALFAAFVARAQCPDQGTVTYEGVSNAKGKPYQARAVVTIVTYGENGQKKVVVTKKNLFRDAQGRTRLERFYDGTADPLEDVPTDIWINDNCGTSVGLLPRAQTAKIQKMVLPPNVSHAPHCQEIDPKNPPYTGPEGKFEDLGKKYIDGVEVQGGRETYYTSVQAKLSGAPPVRIYEHWCSTTLETPMDDYILEDHPKIEITTVISDIKQVEPDPALFEIPKEYKIIHAQQSAPAASPEK